MSELDRPQVSLESMADWFLQWQKAHNFPLLDHDAESLERYLVGKINGLTTEAPVMTNKTDHTPIRPDIHDRLTPDRDAVAPEYTDDEVRELVNALNMIFRQRLFSQLDTGRPGRHERRHD